MILKKFKKYLVQISAGVFLVWTAFKPALGPTQPYIQWVAGAPSSG
jgi:hypothetical protein